MKRKGYLYQDIIDKSNIRKAIIKSSKGKTKRRDVCKILDNLEYYVEEIQKMLINKSYRHSDYKIIKIYDMNNKEGKNFIKAFLLS